MERIETDRRTVAPVQRGFWRHDLNDEQLATLWSLERFGWTLRFVRRTADGQRIAAVYDPDHQVYAVLEADGTLNESPPYTFREERATA